MKRLEKICLVQYFVCDAVELQVSGHTAMLGPNGTGKTAVLDAIQIVMLGADRRYLQFNARKATKGDNRSIRDYCLGVFKPAAEGAESDNGIVRHKRNSAHTYITLVFRDEHTRKPTSIGVALTAAIDDAQHRVKGLYVATGIELSLNAHLEISASGILPLPWKDFEARLRSMTKVGGATLEITDQPEKHIRSLLHAIQPEGVSIDPHEYQKAFKKSVTLNQITNVSDFVRDFLIDEERIDKVKAMATINEFRRLQDLIAEMQERIDRLGELEGKYRSVERAHRRVASLEALKSVYAVEGLAELTDSLSEQIEECESNRETVTRKLIGLEPQIAEARAQLRELELRLAQDEPTRELKHHQQVLSERQVPFDRQLLQLQRSFNAISQALLGSSRYLLTSEAKQAATSADQKLSQTAQAAGRDGNWLALKDAVRRAMSQLQQASPVVEAALSAAARAYEDASQEYDAEVKSIERERKGGVRLSGTHALAFTALEEVGIEARPVCELVEVTRPEWRAAIEAYLGPNRFAFLVPQGLEDRAVRTIRNPARRINGVKVVQPTHFAGRKWQDSAGVLVGSLIAGDDPIAVAYVRHLLGGLRMVESERELREHSQALTTDGMLSKSGSTSSLDIRTGDLVLGRRARVPSEEDFQHRLDDLLAKKASAENAWRDVKAVHQRVVQVTADEARTAVDELLIEVPRAAEGIAEIERLIAGISTAHVDGLNQQIDEIRGRITSLEGEKEAAQRMDGSLDTQLQNLKKSYQQALQDAQTAKTRQAECISHQDFDPGYLEEMRMRFDGDGSALERTYPQRIDAVEGAIEDYRTRAEQAYSRAVQDFLPFVDRCAYPVLEERSDWRKALVWIVVTKEQLTNTKLHERQPEADRARQVAEESFRRDIAFKLREGIEKMRANIRAINRILESCPPFSNNERYKFTYSVAKAHEDLYRFITTSVDDPSGDLFGGEGELSAQIMELLKTQPADGPEPAKTPLDDFRLMFNFDLDLLENGVVFGKLSKRIGTGSNGEHLTPFYVIAAAALTHAYRIDAKNRGSGAALMLLDEAFGAMDDQNAIAAARFISGLGLQMIMAAPSADSAKLSSFTNTIYEMDRYGGDVYFEREEVTDEGHALLRSDMPAENPQLVDDLVSKYNARAASGA